MTGYEDFTVEQTRGDGRAFRFTVVNTNNDDAPIDLSTWTNLEYLAKKRIEDADADAVIHLTEGAGITRTDDTNGVLDLTAPEAETSGLGDRRYQLIAFLRGDHPTAGQKTVQRGVHIVWPT
jgi:hypothetical protein